MDIWFSQHAGGADFRQQDAVLVAPDVHQSRDLPVTSAPVDPKELLLGVADGVSGSPSAGQASQLLLKLLSHLAFARAETLPDGLLDVATIRVAAETFRDQLLSRRAYGAATTFAILQVHSGKAMVANCGDSRVYRIAASEDGGARWRQLSKDHTVLTELREAGAVAGQHRDLASIYSGLAHCIIADPEEGDVWVHRVLFDIAPGDTFLLTTDGMHEVLGNDLQALYDPLLSLPDQVARWRTAILAAGPLDNFSLVACRFPSAG